MSRKQRIYDLLMTQLHPQHLLVSNESHQHNVPEGSETHFKILVISNYFKDLTKINRHRAINTLLANELTQGLHALSLNLYTPEEWEARGETFPESPNCRGGYLHK